MHAFYYKRCNIREKWDHVFEQLIAADPRESSFLLDLRYLRYNSHLLCEKRLRGRLYLLINLFAKNYHIQISKAWSLNMCECSLSFFRETDPFLLLFIESDPFLYLHFVT